MKQEIIAAAVGGINDGYILEYASYEKKKSGLFIPLKWYTVAASVALFAVIAAAVPLAFGGLMKAGHDEQMYGWKYEFQTSEEFFEKMPENSLMHNLADYTENFSGYVYAESSDEEKLAQLAEDFDYQHIHFSTAADGIYLHVYCVLDSRETALSYVNKRPISFGVSSGSEIKTAKINGIDVYYGFQSYYDESYENRGYMEDWRCAFSYNGDLYEINAVGQSVPESEFLELIEQFTRHS